jgi:hypothetical protein
MDKRKLIVSTSTVRVDLAELCELQQAETLGKSFDEVRRVGAVAVRLKKIPAGRFQLDEGLKIIHFEDAERMKGKRRWVLAKHLQVREGP